jgi:hypothetical protein
VRLRPGTIEVPAGHHRVGAGWLVRNPEFMVPGADGLLPHVQYTCNEIAEGADLADYAELKINNLRRINDL